MRAFCRYTRRRFETTHGDVLNLHTVFFFACQAAPHTPHTPTTHHTTHHTPHTTDTTHHTKAQTGVAFLSVVALMFAPSVGAMMNGAHAFATSGGTAWRRRQRRLRALRRYVLWHSKMEVAAALHHTSGSSASTTAHFPLLQWILMRFVSLVLFLLLKSLLCPCSTKSLRCSLLLVKLRRT